MLKWIYTLACLVLVNNVYAQRFAGTPPDVKWKQINTDSARIIFPSDLDSQAQRVASLVHYQAGYNPVSLGDQLRKINIVLQNQTTIANGYVGLGPYRSEFYMTPAVNNFEQGSVAWGDGLAIHEYRHVQQFNNFRNGISKLMGTLFGQEGYAVAVNASVPDWFFEGDAVYQETILSRQGRGRLPLFMNAYPSVWKAGKKFSWMKLRNGSLKDYVPNHYNLGYLLVNYGYEKYGLDFWGKVNRDASAFKGLIYPFQKAIEKHAGVEYQTFRNDAFDFYKALTPALSGQGLEESAVRNITAVNKRYVTNAMFPYQVSGDSLVYFKTSFRHRPAFYIRDAAGEKRLRVRDISIDQQFSFRNGKIVYASYERDALWAWRDYSVIKLLDLYTGRQRSITHRSKYFSPDISASGNRIVAVEIAINGKSELHILDAGTGEVKNKISSAEVSLFTDPKFIGEDSVVSAVRLPDGKMALAISNLTTGSTIRLTPPSYNVVGFPFVSNNIVYFTASYGGKDNVYALKPGDQQIYKITNGPLGNYFVNVGDGKITWSAFTAEGYQLQQQDETAVVWEPVNMSIAEELNTAYPVSQRDKVSEILSGNATKRGFPVSNYKKGNGLLNFHSWRPYYEDPEFTFSLYGENILNTLQTEIYYLYNQNENSNAVGFNAVYGKWFPYLSIGSQMTFALEDSVENILRQWNQLDSRVGLNVPLSFILGRTVSFLNVGTNFGLRNEFNSGPNKNLTGTEDFTYLHHYINWSQEVETARQHIYPRLGYSVSVNHRYAVTNVDAYQFLSRSSLFLPGLASTHNVVLNGAFQQRDTASAFFGSGFPNARGYSDYYRTNAGSRMWRVAANYHLPLFYPDWGFGNILYFQRIRGNLFYDLQRLYSNTKTQTVDLRSTGVEFYADTKWWNQYELTFGFRISRLLDNDLFTGSKATVYEFILPVSIFPK